MVLRLLIVVIFFTQCTSIFGSESEASGGVVGSNDDQEFGVKNTPQDTFDVQENEFTLDSTVIYNPTVTCHYLVAKSKDSGIKTRTNSIILYFCFPTESEYFKSSTFRRFASECGFTVMGIFFNGHSKDNLDIDDKRSYLWASSGSFQAYISALAMVRQREGLSNDKVFCFGDSGGGTASQHFAEEYPNLCDGFVTLGGQLFIERNSPSCPELIMNTAGDANVICGEGLHQYGTALHVVSDYGITQPEWSRRTHCGALFSHCMNSLSFDLAREFLIGLSDLRSRNKGEIPDCTCWPYATSRSRPKAYVSPAKYWKSHFTEDDVVFAPTKQFYALWRENPPPPAPPVSDRKHKSIVVGFPAPSVTAPKGVIVYYWKDKSCNLPMPGDSHSNLNVAYETAYDIRFLLDQGYIAVSLEGAIIGLNEDIYEIKTIIKKEYPTIGKLSFYILDSMPSSADLQTLSRERDYPVILFTDDDTFSIISGLERKCNIEPTIIHYMLKNDGENTSASSHIITFSSEGFDEKILELCAHCKFLDLALTEIARESTSRPQSR